MKLHYYKDTDSLYINLSHSKSVDSQEISDGVVLDFDKDGKVVGIDIDQASKIVNIAEVITTNLPSAITEDKLSA
jgi:uncharacterized protein YuzE